MSIENGLLYCLYKQFKFMHIHDTYMSHVCKVECHVCKVECLVCKVECHVCYVECDMCHVECIMVHIKIKISLLKLILE